MAIYETRVAAAGVLETMVITTGGRAMNIVDGGAFMGLGIASLGAMAATGICYTAVDRGRSGALKAQ